MQSLGECEGEERNASPYLCCCNCVSCRVAFFVTFYLKCELWDKLLNILHLTFFLLFFLFEFKNTPHSFDGNEGFWDLNMGKSYDLHMTFKWLLLFPPVLFGLLLWQLGVVCWFLVLSLYFSYFHWEFMRESGVIEHQMVVRSLLSEFARAKFKNNQNFCTF